MRNIWTIAKREYHHFFISPIAYAIAFLFIFIIGTIFSFYLLFLASNPFSSPPDTTFLTSWMAILLLLTSPALTMRAIAEEIRMGTMELLLTLPVRNHELVTGKWLGTMLFTLTLIAATLIFPLILGQLVSPGIDLTLMLAGYLGVTLLAGAFLALGTGISALFGNQITAFIVTLIALLGLWTLIGIPASIFPASGDIFRYMNASAQFYDNFNTGNVTLGGIIYYLSLTIFGLLIGTSAVEFRRWR